MPAERRRHPRHEVSCPVVLLADGVEVARTRAVDLSDGGLLVPLPGQAALDVGQDLLVKLALPRTTEVTHMLERFELQARVVRLSGPTDGQSVAGLAFRRPQDFLIRV